MADARMLGRVSPSWCPYCRTVPGSDCPDRGRTSRQVRRTEEREVARTIAEETAAVTEQGER